MLVMLEVTAPEGGADAITRKQDTTGVIDVKALLAEDGDYLHTMVQGIVQATLEAEMTARARRREARADERAAGLSFGVLHARPDHPGRHAGAQGAAGWRRTALDPGLRAPEVVEAILDGRQRAELQLDELLEGFPLEWVEQTCALMYPA
jgi:hypothetical protein